MAEIGCRLGEAEALRGLARTAAAQRNFRQVRALPSPCLTSQTLLWFVNDVILVYNYYYNGIDFASMFRVQWH